MKPSRECIRWKRHSSRARAERAGAVVRRKPWSVLQFHSMFCVECGAWHNVFIRKYDPRKFEAQLRSPI